MIDVQKEVVNDLVNYGNLKIVQNKDYFNFSLDSILLPNFALINSKMKNILDLCTGNAPIPLILSQKTKSHIYGIELQKEIYDLAIKTVNINGLGNQITIINDDVKNYRKYFNTDSVDLMLCNPPYFKINKESLRNDNEIKTIARHEVAINSEDIIKTAKVLLKNNASICMINITDRLSEILCLMRENNIEPKRLRLIYPKNNTKSNMFIIDGRKNGSEGLEVLPPLIVHNNDGSYTDEVLSMFGGN